MGNMGNPVSTRLGVNQFWYKHWYSDSSKSLELQQDASLETLISIYLQYGLSFQTNPFIHEYWYKKNSKDTRVILQSKLNSRFFRRFFYTNDVLSIEHSYLVRNKTPEYFPLRTWVFKYSGWVIFSVQWFKPLKIKPVRRNRSSGSSTVSGIAKAGSTVALLRRVKLLLLFTLRSVNDNYRF